MQLFSLQRIKEKVGESEKNSRSWNFNAAEGILVGTVKSGNFVTEHNFVTTASNFWSGLVRLLLNISNFCENQLPMK
jgi:hypothetical protein